ncbi:hypothetical protein [Pseudomonas donghuensis]|uniref:hypothetical protein n=1 Tax=Pseudomonas donghuensis TaxID=1163398 RepID=UPI000C29B9D6|nr:hypothetical protein [Pseudomonas donghuensis]PJY94686.1 hypothetical protein COO64_20280 [Pseudomonas donghuensis]WKY29640.1 hypothetical protein QYF67_06470 [Pseudomonas donghuensis]
MSKAIEFPQAPKVEVIDEAFFDKFADVALLMMCFEGVADAVEVVEEGVRIRDRDEIHVKLMEACMALAVLFRRRTGYDVQQISADHLEEQRRCLLAGEEPRLLIPIRASVLSPLPATAFSGLPDLELAQVSFNYASRVREHVKGNCPQLVELDLAQTHSVDALSALSLLISRLAGGAAASLQDKLVSEVKINAPTSETLQ